MKRYFLLGVLAALPATVLAVSARAADQPQGPTQAEMAADFLSTIHRMADEMAKSPAVVVAEIGGQAITRGDVADAFRTIPATEGNRPFDAVYREVVQRLLVRKALAIRAREKGIDKEPEEQRRMVAATDNVLADAYLQRTVAAAVTDQMLHQAYDSQIAGKPGPDEVRARIILAYTEAQATDALTALVGGEDFAALAQRVSKDASAAAGGDIGFVRRESVSPEVGAVMFALAPGQTTSFPVRSGGAWFVIKVESRRQVPPPSFEAARAGLMQQLLRAGVPAVMKTAMAGLPVQDYGMAGKNPGVGAGKSSGH